MRPTLPIACLLLASGLAGCEKAPTVIPGAKHDGYMSALLDEKGYIEVRFEGASKGGGRGKPEPRVLVAYFYGPDGATPMSPPPTEVTIKVGKAEPMPLAPRESDGSFVSKAEDFPQGFRGILAAKLGGEPVETPVAVR